MKAIAEKLCFDLLARYAPKVAGDQVIVLCYHRIVPRGTPPDQVDRFTVYRDDFDAHIATIKAAGFEIINPDRIAGFQGKGVVITFDDNLATHLSDALPVLKKHDVSATFFLNPKCINFDNEMSDCDVDQLVEAGMRIGAHNAEHLIAASMDTGAFNDAIACCTTFLEKYNMDRYWAYPGGYLGSFTTAQDDRLRELGFVRFSTVEGCCTPTDLTAPQSRYVLRSNSSLKYVQAILDGRLRALAKLKRARFTLEQAWPSLARHA